MSAGYAILVVTDVERTINCHAGLGLEVRMFDLTPGAEALLRAVISEACHATHGRVITAHCDEDDTHPAT